MLTLNDRKCDNTKPMDKFMKKGPACKDLAASYKEDKKSDTVVGNDYALLCDEPSAPPESIDSDSDADSGTAETLDYLETMPRSKFLEEFGNSGSTSMLEHIHALDRAAHARRLAEELAKRKPVKTTMQAAIQMKHNWIEYHANQMYQCYYRGNIAILRCEHCFFALDMFPCKEKREYTVPKSRCCYCTGGFTHIGSYNYFQHVETTHYHTKNYQIMEETGLVLPETDI